MKIAVAGATGTVGRHVVERAKAAGHDVAGLSRSQGVDVRTGRGLGPALDGVDALIDVTNPPSNDALTATAFFTEAAERLQRVGAERGVRHVVTLSIVGIDRTSFGYYAAKLAQERAVGAGPVASTILRATQFHEFPAQLIARTRTGAQARVYDVRVRTVAARTVARILVELAEGAPHGRARDLAGPEEADLVALARRYVERRRLAIAVRADSQSIPGVPPGALLPGDDARIEGPTFEEWLESADAAAVAV